MIILGDLVADIFFLVFTIQKEKKMISKENKKYKNSVFVDLFYEDETADANDIALYNALHEETLPEATQITRFRVDDVLYMNFKNDISFGVENKIIVFGEHQSTINFNMPLRSLMYIGRAYEQLVPIKERYKKKLIKIPTPEFFTFYNGRENAPIEEILSLSDAFIVPPSMNGTLELKVKIINIKPEQEHELLNRCKVLREYALFMECIEKYSALRAENAIELAVKECVEKNILREYLNRKGSQVRNMLIAEYDYEMDIEVQREEAWEDGNAAGMTAGITTGKAMSILEILSELGTIPEKLHTKIMSEKNINILTEWIKLAAKSDTIEEFENNIH